MRLGRACVAVTGDKSRRKQLVNKKGLFSDGINNAEMHHYYVILLFIIRC
jgi:hypothetical protein